MHFRLIRGPIAAGLIPVLILNGCYAYLPVTNGALKEGTEVRVELAAPENIELGLETYFGIGAVEGEIAASDDRSLVAISTTWLRSWRGGEKFWGTGALVFIPHDRISVLEERRLSSGRTAMAVGLGALAFAAVIGFATIITGGTVSGLPGGGTGTDF